MNNEERKILLKKSEQFLDSESYFVSRYAERVKAFLEMLEPQENKWEGNINEFGTGVLI